MSILRRSNLVRQLCLIGCLCFFSISNAQTSIKEIDIEVEKIKAPPRDIKDILRVLELLSI